MKKIDRVKPESMAWSVGELGLAGQARTLIVSKLRPEECEGES